MKWSNDVKANEMKTEIKWSTTIVAEKKQMDLLPWNAVGGGRRRSRDQCGEPLKRKRVMHIYT